METKSLSPQGAQSRGHRAKRRRGLFALPFVALLLAGCKLPSFGAYQSDTVTGRSTYHLWQGFSVAAAIIGGFTLLLILWTVLRYRRKNVDAVPRQVQYHVPLELLYTIVPILIVIGLFAATVVVENQVEAMPATNVVINANAFQWGWGFTYPGHNAIAIGNTTETPTMVMPVDTNVRVVLTATDVVHGFYVREFNFSRFALPGVVNQFTFRAQNTGTFWGQCSQLCGLYHSIMFFKVKVVTQDQYRAWLATFETPSGKAAAIAAAAALKQQLSAHVPVLSYVSQGVK